MATLICVSQIQGSNVRAVIRLELSSSVLTQYVGLTAAGAGSGGTRQILQWSSGEFTTTVNQQRRAGLLHATELGTVRLAAPQVVAGNQRVPLAGLLCISC